MKKLVLLSLVLFLAGYVSVNAEKLFKKESVELLQDEKKTEVEVGDLPEPVSTSLTTEDNAGWSLSKAFLVEKEEEQYYSVELSKDGETKTVNVSKDGELL